MPICYRNPQGDTSRVEEVTALTPEQEARRQQVELLQARIADGDLAKAELATLQKKCNHKEHFFDRPGVPYDSRHCYVCAAYCGLI